MKKIILCFVTLWSLNGFAGHKCKLPSADSADSTGPFISGKILKVETSKKEIEISAMGQKKTLNIKDESAIQIFTQYGGAVQFNELKNGDIIEVWLKNCKTSKKKKIVPAVIRLMK